MKKAVFAVAAVAVAVMFAMPSFAQEAHKKDANKEAKTATKPHEFTGAITALDAAKGSVTLKNNKDKEQTFTVTDKTPIATADKAVATLADLKVGDKVKVDFTEEAGKVTVKKISPVKAKEAKPAAAPKAPAPAPAQ